MSLYMAFDGRRRTFWEYAPCMEATDQGNDRFWMDQDVKFDFTADLTGTGDRSVNVISET